jgi:membrane carboxypeptidase/penicillin-binding protein PbpC
MIPGSGEVRALVGSVDWYDLRIGKVNMAVSPRQPGSAFKPFVYALALESRAISAATVLRDMPLTVRITGCRVNCIYKPRNYDGRFRGQVTVRRALANSLNVPAVQVMQKVGVERVVAKANELGVESIKEPANYGPSLVLGAGEATLLEMTQGYAAFANGGKIIPAKLYTQISNKSGKVIEKNNDSGKRVWSEYVAFIINSILSDNRARSEMFGNALTISRPAAVKTGTTDNYRDAWTIGYTPDLIVGVWVGNNYNEPMSRVAGSLGAAPVWRELMEKFSMGTVIKKFSPPEGIAGVAACTGGVRDEATGSARIEYFIPGTRPAKSCYSTPKNFAASQSGSFEFGVGGAPPVTESQTSSRNDKFEIEYNVSEVKNSENAD